MGIQEPQGNIRLLPPELLKAIQRELETEFDQTLKEFVEKMNSKKEEIIATIAVRLSRHMNVQTFRDQTIIEIHNNPTHANQ